MWIITSVDRFLVGVSECFESIIPLLRGHQKSDLRNLIWALWKVIKALSGYFWLVSVHFSHTVVEHLNGESHSLLQGTLVRGLLMDLFFLFLLMVYTWVCINNNTLFHLQNSSAVPFYVFVYYRRRAYQLIWKLAYRSCFHWFSGVNFAS